MKNFILNVICVAIVVLAVLFVGYICYLPIAAISDL